MASQAAQPERGQRWDGVVRRSFDVELRVLDEAERTIEVTASSETLDAHGDIIRQFWDLERYEKNPVVLWNHNRFGVHQYSYEGAIRPEDLFPIGQSLETKVKSKKLVAKLKLGSAEYSAIAEKVFLGCKERIIRAVSVGFRPGSITAVKDKAGNTKYYELGSAEFPNELREISFVPMGSNPDAVAKSIEFERENLGRMLAERSGEAPPAPHQETDDMAMTTEEKAEFDGAKSKAAVAEARVGTLEGELQAERALAKKLQVDLTAMTARATTAESAGAKTELDQRQGKKFAPAERAEIDALVFGEKNAAGEIVQPGIGLQRALKMLDARPDLAVTSPVAVGGKKIGDQQTAPAPVSDDKTEDPQGTFDKTIAERVKAA